MSTIGVTAGAPAGPAGFNYEESQVPAYTLPDPLTMEDGTKVTDATIWDKKRRPQIFKLFETEVYGRCPISRPEEMTATVTSEKKDARGGKAIRREIAIRFTKDPAGPRMNLLVYTPAGATQPVPTFLGLNFEGNHAITEEADVKIAECWVPNTRDGTIKDNRANESTRGAQASRWAIDYALEHGYGLATICYGDIDPDFDDGFKNGVHPLAPKNPPAADEWGSIAAWAWGLSRTLDILQQDALVDGKKVIVTGHSRLGKTALWAGAQDQRFAAVISNDSGAGGAALSRRIFGETIARLNSSFPHWFCDNYNRYNDNEAACPVDQHELIALIAPRPCLINSATEDLWADPKGEFLSALHADPVYRLLASDGLAGCTAQPPPSKLVGGRLSYYLRPGKHDVTPEDWQAYVAFADREVKPLKR